MLIRRLGTNDGELLARVVREVIPAQAASSAHLEDALSDANCYFIVAVADEVPVGYLSGYRFPAVDHDGFLVYLYDVTVHPDHRRRGIGVQLVNALRDACGRDGVTEIWAGTSRSNTAAQRTFETTGAERVSDTYVEYTYDLDD